MKQPKNPRHLVFGGTFVLANKLQSAAVQRVQGLTTKQYLLLYNIIDLPKDPPPSLRRIARDVGLTHQAVSRMLKTLELRGIVTVGQNVPATRGYGLRRRE